MSARDPHPEEFTTLPSGEMVAKGSGHQTAPVPVLDQGLVEAVARALVGDDNLWDIAAADSEVKERAMNEARKLIEVAQRPVLELLAQAEKERDGHLEELNLRLRDLTDEHARAIQLEEALSPARELATIIRDDPRYFIEDVEDGERRANEVLAVLDLGVGEPCPHEGRTGGECSCKVDSESVSVGTDHITFIPDRYEPREALRQILNVLPEDCPQNTCEGCRHEIDEARRIATDVLPGPDAKREASSPSVVPVSGGLVELTRDEAKEVLGIAVRPGYSAVRLLYESGHAICRRVPDGSDPGESKEYWKDAYDNCVELLEASGRDRRKLRSERDEAESRVTAWKGCASRAEAQRDDRQADRDRLRDLFIARDEELVVRMKDLSVEHARRLEAEARVDGLRREVDATERDRQRLEADLAEARAEYKAGCETLGRQITGLVKQRDKAKRFEASLTGDEAVEAAAKAAWDDQFDPETWDSEPTREPIVEIMQNTVSDRIDWKLGIRSALEAALAAAAVQGARSSIGEQETGVPYDVECCGRAHETGDCCGNPIQVPVGGDTDGPWFCGECRDVGRNVPLSAGRRCPLDRDHVVMIGRPPGVSETATDPLTVVCPKCLASVGFDCRTTLDRLVRAPHPERVEAVSKASDVDGER